LHVAKAYPKANESITMAKVDLPVGVEKYCILRNKLDALSRHRG
jgi:hypothetical protein